MNSTLPQLERLCIADAGLESDMIFNHGLDLPCFASVTLLRTEAGRAALRRYFVDFIELAKTHATGVVLESATWRASRDWAEPLGLGSDELDRLNVEAIALLNGLRDELGTPETPIVVSGCIGPRGDGYDPGKVMSVAEADAYHRHQVEVLASAAPDMLSAITMTNVNEAIGIARASVDSGLPVAISFTVETDGLLPTGESLAQAIAAVDEATDAHPAYYMINCAHPTHFAGVLRAGGGWTTRLRGIRANASKCSHAELDAMTELDDGDPAQLAAEYRQLVERLPQLTVLGGCCGTDIRHIRAIADNCIAAAAAA